MFTETAGPPVGWLRPPLPYNPALWPRPTLFSPCRPGAVPTVRSRRGGNAHGPRCDQLMTLRRPADQDIVVIGATGDLAARKLLPAPLQPPDRGSPPRARRCHRGGPAGLGRRALPRPCGGGGPELLAQPARAPALRRVRGPPPLRRHRPGWGPRAAQGGRPAARTPSLPGRAGLRVHLPGRGAGRGGTGGRHQAGDREALRSRRRVGDAGSTPPSTRSSPRSGSTGSTTTWGRRRSRTCWSSASATRSSSGCGIATRSRGSRSRSPSPSASSTAAPSTRRPARSATSSRTTCSSSSR